MMLPADTDAPCARELAAWRARRVAARQFLTFCAVLGGPVGVAVQPRPDRFGRVEYSPWQIVVGVLLLGGLAGSGACWLYCAYKSKWFTGRGYGGMRYGRTIAVIAVVCTVLVTIVALSGR